ncbi:ferritin-like fold-containing protein [Jonesia quinghaiensis]|uniref:ferritin-like fold-containing protein n=1 Tax=Jonesia quinghaiensis TaxID=262806 RepID=UPI0003F94013|nr:ferritin-like fold-containing protein [Jonesia quinghaiensis]
MSYEPATTATDRGDSDVTELLGLLAYTQLSAALRHAQDAALTTHLSRRLACAELSAQSHAHFTMICEHIDHIGGDSLNLLRRYNGAFDEYEQRTAADSWHERIVKGYVGHTVAIDFCRIAIVAAPAATRTFVETLLTDIHAQDVAVDILRAKTQEDATFASRLALWARRIVGEALNQVQSIVTREPALARLVTKGAEQAGFLAQPDSEMDANRQEMSWLYSQLTAEHSRRMDRVGLAA